MRTRFQPAPIPRDRSPGVLVLAVAVLAGCVTSPPGAMPAGPPEVVEQASGTGALLQAVGVVDSEVVWASGHDGTYVRTRDGGETWEAARGPGPDSLQFRDVHARDAWTAWLLAAGPGALSRIYRTDDGGESWALQWTNPEPSGFYDCLDFWDGQRGIAYGDAVGGALRVLRTEDGGAHWERMPERSLPPALPGEGGFAASGLCVTVRPGGVGWIGAGNTTVSRVFRTYDYGRIWYTARAPVAAGEGAGITAVSMVDDALGYVFGGALDETDERTRNVARTTDGGVTWVERPPLSFPGPAYGGVAVPATRGRVLVAVGPGGAAVSDDGGSSWTTVDERSWWAVGSVGLDATWIVGPEGRIARIVW